MMMAEVKSKVLVILTRHVGLEKAIGMGELYQEVFGGIWRNRINDTRVLRKVITALRYEGSLIGETRSHVGGGYYLARSAHELGTWFQRREHEWLKKAAMLARMKRQSLNEYLGQKSLGLAAGSKEHGAESREQNAGAC